MEIPKSHAFMHLDRPCFTMIDRDKFTIHPEIRDGGMNCFIFGEGVEGRH